MLTQLSVRNFTLVKSLDVTFEKGMTAITGETGAGKSILLNALGLTLGDRADYGQIRQNEDRAEVHAEFDITSCSDAQIFLKENELDDNDECLLRRVITAGGNSKAWINGQPVTLSTLRLLAEQLISIHSQHEHQRLTSKEQQLQILDNHAGHQDLCHRTASTYREWLDLKSRLEAFEKDQTSMLERLDLLKFQTHELDELALQPNEYASLETEQHQLANAESILNELHRLNGLVVENEEFNLLSASSQASQIAEHITAPNDALAEATTLLSNANIQLEEARESIRKAIDSVEINPERLSLVESRLSRAFELSRKHRVTPTELIELQENLSNELAELESGDANLDNLRDQEKELASEYTSAAQELNASREKYATALTEEINSYFDKLSMSGAELKILLNRSTPSQKGGIDIEFQVRTNPGQPHKPLSKVASGGELSRISLAIQVVTAQTNDSSALVFDEVDVGIGGATAAVVGDLLRKLGEHAQVICVTHLAQVASRAHSQLGVSKESKAGQTETSILPLDKDTRIQEIARMIGGIEVTEQSLAHAGNLLESTD